MSRVLIQWSDVRPAWALPAAMKPQIQALFPADWSVRFIERTASGRGDGGGQFPDEFMFELSDLEVYFGFGLPAAVRDNSPHLKWAHSSTAGVGGSMHPSLRERGILFTNSRGLYAPPIADHVLGAILHFHRGFDRAARASQKCEWDEAWFVQAPPPVRELAGTKVLVVGFGGIGREVAARATLMNMEVVALRRTVTTSGMDGAVHVAPAAELDAHLPWADVVVLTVPETGETRALLNDDRLALMRPESVLINISRGGLVDETALAARLADGRLRGAALDVVVHEPLASGSPLWSLPNVLITPHVSGVSSAFWPRQLELIRHNVSAWMDGRPLRNVVDLEAGY